MIQQKKIVFLILIFVSSFCFSAVKSEKDKLIEELTGESSLPIQQNISDKQKSSISAKHLRSGIEALKRKDYILSLKYLNTIILKYSNSPEVTAAYSAKANLYTIIGLPEQAQLNTKLATMNGMKISK